MAWTKRTPISTDFEKRTKPVLQDWLLSEDGSLLLSEDGSVIVLETTPTIGFAKRTPITTDWTKR